MTPATVDDPQHAPPPGGIFAGHSDRYRPLGSYAALTALFNGLAGAWLVSASRAGRLPERVGAGDIALVGVATARLSRLVARDRVLAAVRAPFTRFQDDASHGEVDEAARGLGMRRALGELLVCDYCLGQWFSAAGIAGLTAAPRTTRTVAAVFAAYTVSDWLQLAWSTAQERS